MAASAQTLPVSGISGQALNTPGTGIQLQLASRGSFTTGTRGAGGLRYLYATFRVRNADGSGVPYSSSRQNLTFVAASTPSTIGETPLSTFKKFDGTAANAALAPQVLPTHGMTLDPLNGQPALLPGGEDFQIFTESEVDPTRFQTPTTAAALGVTRLFPYGFVVRNVGTAANRTLPASPGAAQFDGVVTFAVKVPLQASASDDPFSFSMMFQAVDDPNTRVTESVEEQALGSQVAARATALGSAEVAALCGTPLTGPRLKFIPSVTTAGNTARLARLGGNFVLTGPAPVLNTVGNTGLNVAATDGFLSRVQAVAVAGQTTPSLTFSAPATSTRGGDVTAQPDGSFSFNPKVGDGNVTDTIDYSVSDGNCTTPTGVLQTKVNVGQRVWYVKNDAAAPGDGRRSAPLTTLSAAQSVSGPNDILYVYTGNGTASGQNAGITLQAGQKLIGQGVALTVPLGAGTTTIEPAGARPMVGNAAGAGVTLATNNTVSGLNVSGTTGGLRGTNFGTLTANLGTVSASAGPALALDTGTLDATTVRLDAANPVAGGAGVSLTGVGGTLSVTGTGTADSGGTVTASGTGYQIKPGAAALQFTLDRVKVQNSGTGLSFRTEASDSGRVSLTVRNSTFEGNGSAGIELLPDGSGSNLFTLTGNTIRNTTGSTGLAYRAQHAPGSSVDQGRITGNTVNLATTGSGNGMTVSVQGGGAARFLLENNTINGYSLYGLSLSAQGGSAGSAGRLDATLRGNTVSTPAAALPLDGVNLLSGAADGEQNTLCANLDNNHVSGNPDPGAVTSGVVLRQRSGTTFVLPGLTGSGTNASNVQSFISSRNNGASVRTRSSATLNAQAGTCVEPSF